MTRRSRFTSKISWYADVIFCIAIVIVIGFPISGIAQPSNLSPTPVNGVHTHQSSTANQIKKRWENAIDQSKIASPLLIQSHTSIYQQIVLLTTINSHSPHKVEGDTLFQSEKWVVTKRLNPKFYQEEILSEKIRGALSPVDTKIIDQLTQINPYNGVIQIGSHSYPSPFFKQTIDQYTFHEESTVSDSLLKVTFSQIPVKGNKGLDGFALVNRNKSWVYYIEFHYGDFGTLEHVDYRQEYEWLEGKPFVHATHLSCSYPEQTEITTNRTTGYRAISLDRKVIQQRINPSLTSMDFSSIQQENTKTIKDTISPTPVVGSRASNKNQNYKQQNNNVLRENSVENPGKFELTEKQLQFLRLLAEGKIKIGAFNWEYNRLIGYNLYEGFRPGLGLETNERLSKYYSLGGFVSYGFKDRSWRHGQWFSLYPSGNNRTKITTGFKDSNLEFGGTNLPLEGYLLNPENYRLLLIKNMYQSRKWFISVDQQSGKSLKLSFLADRSVNETKPFSTYLEQHSFEAKTITRIGVGVTYIPAGRNGLKNTPGMAKRTGENEVVLNITQAVKLLNSTGNYLKAELKGRITSNPWIAGVTSMMIRAGLTSNEIPLFEAFNGYGTFAGSFTLAAPYSFATMIPNQFAATRFSAIHIRHNFSPALFDATRSGVPELIFAQNIGFGEADKEWLDVNHVSDFKKGYTESGIEINNLFRFGVLSWGVGLYYHYGAYRSANLKDNLGYKFAFYYHL